MRRTVFVLTLAAAAAAICCTMASAQERVGLGYNVTDDGGCSRTRHALVAEYDGQRFGLDMHGRVRSAPAASNCLDTVESYDLKVARYIDVGGGDVMLQLGVDQQSTQAPYALTLGGEVLARPSDGTPLNVQDLPAGRALTVVGLVGLSTEYRGFRFGGGFNVLPIDWSDGTRGNTMQLEQGLTLGPVELGLTWNIGASHFGDAHAAYHLALSDRVDVGFSLDHRWGLNAVDVGAPAVQTVEQAVYHLAGAPRGSATYAAVTVGYRLGE